MSIVKDCTLHEYVLFENNKGKAYWDGKAGKVKYELWNGEKWIVVSNEVFSLWLGAYYKAKDNEDSGRSEE